jgi:D-alanyl-D-alanine carboxypeptidase (penicillin-binding protein 5/6)
MHAWLLSFFLAAQAFSQGLVVDVADVNSKLPYQIQEVSHIRKNPTYLAPVVEASASIAVDLNTGKILYAKNAYTPVQIASITKIMTALVVREHVQLDEVVTISGDASRIDGSGVGLLMGDELTVNDLLYGLLVESGNDAAIALAEHVGGGDVDRFVLMMNDYAKKIELQQTSFSNPMGFDSKDNYSTAYEVQQFTSLLLKDSVLREIVSTPEVDIVSLKENTYKLVNTNKTLGGFLDIRGVKTGTTDMAGASLVSVSYLNDTPVIGVVLRSPRRFHEIKILLDWCYRAHSWGE